MEEATKSVGLASWLRTLTAGRSALLVAVIVTSLAASLTEGLGVGLVVSLVDSAQGGSSWLARMPGVSELLELAGRSSLAGRVRMGGAILMAILIVRGVLYAASRISAVWLEEGVVRGLRERLYGALLARDLTAHAGEPAGHLLTALNKYSTDAGLVVRMTAMAVVDVATILVYLTVLLVVSWKMTLIAVGLLGLSSVAVRGAFKQRQVASGRRVNRAESRLNAFGLETVAALPLVRLYQLEDRFRSRFAGLTSERERSARRQGVLAHLNRPLFVSVNAFVLCLLMIGSTWVLSDRLEASLGFMGLFLAVALRLLTPALVVADLRGRLATLVPSAGSLLEILEGDAEPPPVREEAVPFAGLEREVTFEAVSYRYRGRDEAALHEVGFALERGTTTGLVGPSGSGKSTVANLLAGLLACDTGRILVDGVNLAAIDRTQWLERVAMVPQDTFLFHETALENIRLGRPDANLDEVREACRRAHALEFLDRLPEGLATVVGERGSLLSAGQRQRLAIARAILRDPEVLILDEATSDLDSESERKIQEALAEMRGSRTVLIVAHRLATVRDADNLVVLEAGRVVEQGSHERLMAVHGPYRQLVEAQAGPQGSETRKRPVQPPAG